MRLICIWGLILLLYNITSGLKLKLPEEYLQKNNYADALSYITRKYPVNTYEIIVQADETNVHNYNRIMGYVNRLVEYNADQVHTLSVNELTDKTSFYNILFIDGYQSFLTIEPYLEKHANDRAGQYLVALCVQDIAFYDIMTAILEKFFEKGVIFVLILVRSSENVIDFYSFNPYAGETCGKIIPVRVNRFENGQLQTKMVQTMKCANLKNCTLNVFTWNIHPFMIIKKTTESHNQIHVHDFTGLEGELLKTIAKTMNFSINLITNNNYDWGYINGAIKATGPYAMLKNGSIDVHIGYVPYNHSRLRHYASTNIYFSSDLLAVVKRQSISADYTYWMYDPFRPETWILIIFLAFLTFFIVSSVSLPNMRIENCFTTLGNFLGVPGALRLRKNWTTFVMSLHLSLLVLRSAYQGKVYDSYNIQHIKMPPPTFQDLVMQNYTILCPRSFFDPITKRTFLQTHADGANSEKMLLSLLNTKADEKYAALINNARLIHFMLEYNQHEAFTPVSQPVNKGYFCAVFKKRSCLAPAFTRVIEGLLSAGIISKWSVQFEMDSLWYKSFRKASMNLKRPSQMKVEKFKLAFLLLFSFHGLSFVVFLIELIYGRLNFSTVVVIARNSLSRLRFLKR